MISADPLARAIEQQENHATECLAACLVFSSKIREAFLEYLLRDDRLVFDSSECEVVTQEPIESGWVDLVLEQRGKFVVAVEVKIKSPEDCDHHRNQLQNYSKWLDKREPFVRLLTLVRNENRAFDPRKYGANGRRTWLGLYKRFQEMLRSDNLQDVESSLLKNFCDYLGSEAIVSTYEMKDLLSYAEGVKARRAVNGIFNQISSWLESQGFEMSSIEDWEDYWPQLKIRHPRWNKIFGNGNNEKISLWFWVPGIWEAKEHGFSPDIELWHRDHGNDWSLGKPKLSNWLATLRSRKFKWDVYERGFNKCRENLSASEIQSEPTRIVAYKEADDITLDQSQLPSEDEPINTLVKLIKEYAVVVGSLAS